MLATEGGVSAFGVETTRSVLGAGRDASVGLEGREAIEGVNDLATLWGVSVLTGVDIVEAKVGAAF